MTATSNFQRFKSCLLTFAMTSLLLGCAAPDPVLLTAKNREYLHHVYIDPSIPLPATFSQGAAAANAGTASAGLLGTALAAVLDWDDAEGAKEYPLQVALANNNIKIDDILLTSIRHYAKENTAFTPSEKDQATSVLKVSVLNYGVKRTYPFGIDHNIHMLVVAHIDDLQGHTIWLDSASVGPFTPGNDGEQSLRDFYTRPPRLINALTMASQAVTKKLFGPLK